MAVIVQIMIPADCSGILFTRGIPPYSSNNIVINAVLGLGEGTVSGVIASDLYILNRDTLNIAEIKIAQKQRKLACYSAKSGIVYKKVSRSQEFLPALNQEEISQIVKLGMEIENLLSSNQDIEWCFLDGKCYITQSRPISILDQSRTKEVEIQIMDSIQGIDKLADWWLSDNLGNNPLAPLAQSIWSISAGAREDASEELGLPQLLTWGIFNGYIYVGSRPISTTEVKEDRERRKITAFHYFAQKWETQFRDEVIHNNELLSKLAVNISSRSTLIDNLESALKIWQRHWVIHDLVMHSKRYLLDSFIEQYKILFGEEKIMEFPVLLQGLDNINRQINKNIWDLAQFALEDETISSKILKSQSFNDLLCDLHQEEQNIFLIRLNSFISQWGNRITGPNDFLHPSWKEDPRFVFRTIQFYLQTNNDSPEILFHKLVKERENKEKSLVTKLPSRELRNSFITSLHLIQSWPVFLEEHNFLIEQTLISRIREIVINIGENIFEAGYINSPEDIFFLYLDEVRNLRNQKDCLNLNILINKRKTEYIDRKNCAIPQTIPNNSANRVTLGLPSEEKLKIIFHQDPGSELPYKLLGLPASPGRFTGTAVVISDIDEFEKIKPGDILVCQRTTPPWTPIFSIIGGLVTNAGSGILQHSAINAREFGIPAVIGTKIATNIIKSGQVITVDGNQGEVILLSKDGADFQ